MTSTSDPLFRVQAQEATLRKRLFINEVIELKEIELRGKLEANEALFRQKQLAASHVHIRAQYDMDNVVVDEHDERKFIQFLYAASMVEWKAFYEKNFYQTIYLEKRSTIFNKLFNQWVEEYLHRRVMIPTEDRAREGIIEPEEEEERRDIYIAFGAHRRRVERLLVEKEESICRQRDLVGQEEAAFAQLQAVLAEDRAAVNKYLFDRWCVKLFADEEAQRAKIFRNGMGWPSSGSSLSNDEDEDAPADHFFEQVKSKCLLGAFRIFGRNDIVGQHQNRIDSFIFTAHCPALVHTEGRERVFLCASEENEWNTNMTNIHKPMIEQHWRKMSALMLQRIGRGFITGRQSVFRNEFHDREYKKRLFKLDCRDASVVLVQKMLRAKDSIFIAQDKQTDYFANLIAASLQAVRSVKVVENQYADVMLRRALLFQRLGRGLFDREEVYELSALRREEALLVADRRNEAALTIQHAWKAAVQRAERKEKKRLRSVEEGRERAATRITKTVKMFIARKRFLKDRYVMRLGRSAQYLQRVFKGARVRQLLHQMLYARTIQRFLRAKKSEKIAFDLYVTPSVVKIQCAFRASVARERAARERMRRRIFLEDKARHVIMRALFLNRYLCIRDRKRMMTAEAKKLDEIAKIQAQFEANKKRFDTLEDLWRIGRGFVARKQMQSLRQQRQSAVSLIQQTLHAAMSDRLLATLHEKERKRLAGALELKRITVIQRFVKAAISHYLAVVPKMASVEAEHQEASFAAAVLQRCGRGMMDRCNNVFALFQTQNSAAEVIQRLFRSFSARKIAAVKRQEVAAKKHAEAVIEAKLYVGQWLVGLIRKRRIAAKTIQLFYHRHSLQMRRNQDLRAARETVFVIQRRELEKQAKLEIDVDVVRAEADSFRRLRQAAVDEIKAILNAVIARRTQSKNQSASSSPSEPSDNNNGPSQSVANGSNFYSPTRHLRSLSKGFVDLDAPTLATIVSREEKRRLQITASFLATVKDVWKARRDALADMFYGHYRDSRILKKEMALRDRIVCSEEVNMRRALMLYHAVRVESIFRSTVFVSLTVQETTSRNAIISSEASNIAYIGGVIRKELGAALAEWKHLQTLAADERQRIEEEKLRRIREAEEEAERNRPRTPPPRRPNVFSAVVKPHEVTPVRDALLRRLQAKPHQSQSHNDTIPSSITDNNGPSGGHFEEEAERHGGKTTNWFSLVPVHGGGSGYQLVVRPFAGLAQTLLPPPSASPANSSSSYSSYPDETNLSDLKDRIDDCVMNSFMAFFSSSSSSAASSLLKKSNTAINSFGDAIAVDGFVAEIQRCLDAEKEKRRERRASGGKPSVGADYDEDPNALHRCHTINKIVFDFTETFLTRMLQQLSAGDEGNTTSDNTSALQHHLALRGSQAILHVNSFLLANPYIISPLVIIDASSAMSLEHGMGVVVGISSESSSSVLSLDVTMLLSLLSTHVAAVAPRAYLATLPFVKIGAIRRHSTVIDTTSTGGERTEVVAGGGGSHQNDDGNCSSSSSPLIFFAANVSIRIVPLIESSASTAAAAATSNHHQLPTGVVNSISAKVKALNFMLKSTTASSDQKEGGGNSTKQRHGEKEESNKRNNEDKEEDFSATTDGHHRTATATARARDGVQSSPPTPSINTSPAPSIFSSKSLRPHLAINQSRKGGGKM